MSRLLVIGCFLVFTPAAASPPADISLTADTLTVTVADGTPLQVEAGTLLVPETRGGEQGRQISIPYYRLRSTSATPAAPIFLLAGGPGASWLDQLERYKSSLKEVRFYRTLADVVLFDQRGGGRAQPSMSCDEKRAVPPHQPFDLGWVAETGRELLTACRDRWLSEGVDLSAYNTVENAADVDALRRALGYDRVTLVGGSYGSHVALALMRLYPQSVERVLMFGIEGLDQTWDDPAARLAAFRRIAAAAEASPELAPHIPEGGLILALQTVIDRLERQEIAAGPDRQPGDTSAVVNSALVRWLTGYQAGKRSRPNAWPEFILDMYHGDFSVAENAGRSLDTLSMDDPMHYSMDCASGISPDRAARYAADPARALLGNINFEYDAFCDVWPARDLGAAFRAPLVSDIPTLIVHGTWDTSTPIENARELVATLSNGRLIEVDGGTHGALTNLYSHWEPAHDSIGAFLRGEAIELPTIVNLPPVKFSARGVTH